MEITEGQPAPAFDMATADGSRVSSAGLAGRPYVVYFYPKADTPGRVYMGIERATLLIDGAGVVRRVWRKVRVKGHAAEVLAAVQSL